jgi:protein-S-isoprenylcysteine O-methyltransferase Ste14
LADSFAWRISRQVRTGGGSVRAAELLVIVALIPVRVWRIIDEEKSLAHQLPGYVAFQQKVRYRLFPHVW